MKKRYLLYFILVLAIPMAGVFGTRFFLKYQAQNIMVIPVEELNPSGYPEDPSHRSVFYSKYGNRTLRLVKKYDMTFDFIFESSDPDVATITFKDIDLNLYVPAAPIWIQDDSNLEIIALVDREWNRQQVKFSPNSRHLEIKGGDGFEKNSLYSAELTRNCLNAGLWEVLLFSREGGEKTLYYQGWFDFPLGHYKKTFNALNGSSYWKHWYRLEHWFDPEGTHLNLAKLRKVLEEKEIAVNREAEERIIVSGEQRRKARIMYAKDVKCWGDFCENSDVHFASFIPPGRYSVERPWKHEYERIARLEKAYLRKIQCPKGDHELHEIELLFRSSRNGEMNRLIVGGIDLNALPWLPVDRYPEGLYMPMGIGVPPFYQSYEELKYSPPNESTYYSLLLDEKGRWINHHEVAIDGPVIHRDMNDPNKIHLYLLSYERHSLVGHFILSL